MRSKLSEMQHRKPFAMNHPLSTAIVPGRNNNATLAFTQLALRWIWLSLICCLSITANAHANYPLVIDTPDTSEYGYLFNGVNNHQDSVEFTFTGGTEDLYLALDAFDIDSTSEVKVRLNGVDVAYLAKTNNNSLGEQFIVFPFSNQSSGTNTIRFEQSNPGFKWGVTNLLLTNDGLPELEIDSINANAYGYLFNGVNTNIASAGFIFTGNSEDLTLSLDTFDIDSSQEVTVMLNGNPIGHLSTTTNNGYGSEELTINAVDQVAGDNTLEFVQATPGWKWGIINLLLEIKASHTLAIDSMETGEFGYSFNGNFNNQEVANFSFVGNGDGLTLDLEAFDIDTATEVSVLLNGVLLGHLDTTENNGYGNTTLELPVLDAGSDNSLSFVQISPGWKWGVTDILLSSVVNPHLTLNVVHQQAYGYAYSGAIEKIQQADFTFSQQTQSLSLELNTYDIDFADEILVTVNGMSIGYLSKTANNGTGNSTLTIPLAVQTSGNNVLSFVQKNAGWRWGISDIKLSLGPPPLPALSNYDLVFNDEFSGSTLDSSKWNTGLLWGPYLPINGEQQLYVDTLGINQGYTHTPFELTGSSLIIRATPTSGSVQPPPRPAENDPIWDDYDEYRYNGPSSEGPGYNSNDVDYLSGIITSNESFNMTHGYVEARVKLPPGRGLWPAFWLLTKHYVEDVPEIDVMEFLGQNTDTVYHTYHYFEPQNNWAKISTPTYETSHPDWTQYFHTFGMAWSPREIVWYVDGVETRRITDSEYKISKQSMYILANLAVGGSWPGEPDSTTPFPAEYEIDYIRAYKKKLNPTLDLNADYQLMFSDEFSGNTLDTTKWNTSFLWGPYLAINNEEQYYVDIANTDQNIGYTPFTVANGTLTITAEPKENSPANVPPVSLPGPNEQIWADNPEFQQGPYPEQADYTSGMITSYDAFKFVNGYAEIRAKIPEGDGLWPAFWLLNAYYVGRLPEIDIMEIVGESPNIGYHTFHRSADDGTPLADQYTSSHGSSSTGYSDDFHTFGVRWEAGKITWYVDGAVVGTYNEPEENRAYQLMYVIANLAVGGNFNSQPVDPSKLPAEYVIDYIRVYQEKDG